MSDHVWVFAAQPGASVYIGGFGRATCDQGVRVPRAVGEEFTGRTDVRVEEVGATAVAVTFHESDTQAIGLTVVEESPRVGDEDEE